MIVFSGCVARSRGFMVGVAIALLGSCTTVPSTESSVEADSTPTVAETEELQVVTTFLPMTLFTEAVAGDRAEVVQLMPTGVGPHDYQATPADAQVLATADILVQNGLELESFLADLIENTGNTDLVVIDSSEGVSTLTSAEYDDHGHEEQDHAEATANDEPKADDDGHAHGEFDPHIWIDPKRAIVQVENIRDGLIAADPEGETEYTANAAEYIAELEALDAEISEKLAPFAGQTFVVFHDFARYFAESYGLKSQFLVGIPEENAAPEDVKRVMETVQLEGLKTIMAEPQANPQSFEAIASDLNISVSVFDPVATADTATATPDYYLTTMRQNVDNLVVAFEGEARSVLPFWIVPPVATFTSFTTTLSRNANVE